MQEEFKNIPGTINYQVSNFGTVIRVSPTDGSKKLKSTRINKYGYSCVNVELTKAWGKNTLVHRLVALTFIPNPDNKPVVDHIDNNRLNNNVNNLRWATIQENSFNQSLSKANISGVKGVRYVKKPNMWRAEIGFNGKSISLGAFNTKEEAIQARKLKANELYGAFTNHIEKMKTDLELLEEEFQNLINKI